MIGAQAGARPGGEPIDPAERARLAHDLRNPLAAASGRVQLLRRRGWRGQLDAAGLQAGLAEIEAALARLAALVERLERGEDG